MVKNNLFVFSFQGKTSPLFLAYNKRERENTKSTSLYVSLGLFV